MHPLLRRRRRPTAPKPEPERLPRFINLGGAAVAVETYQRAWSPTGNTRDSIGYRWRCHGCTATGDNPMWSPAYGLRDVCEHANEHAGKCRALPLTAVQELQ